MITYQAHHRETDKIIGSGPWEDELEDQLEFEGYHPMDYYIIKLKQCRGKGCTSFEAQERRDAHGIPTGDYCDDCYDNNYPYRKDKYPTIETHGYGERLNDDY